MVAATVSASDKNRTLGLSHQVLDSGLSLLTIAEWIKAFISEIRDIVIEYCIPGLGSTNLDSLETGAAIKINLTKEGQCATYLDRNSGPRTICARKLNKVFRRNSEDRQTLEERKHYYNNYKVEDVSFNVNSFYFIFFCSCKHSSFSWNFVRRRFNAHV